MKPPKTRFIASILEEHFEEIQGLWIQRKAALCSAHHTLGTLLRIDDRLEAHVQALLARPEVVSTLVAEALSDSDPAAAFAAGYVLLRLNNEDEARRVLEAFLRSEGGRRDSLRDALCHGPVAPLVDDLWDAFASAAPPLAVAIAEVLAFHGELDRNCEGLMALLQDDDASVRRAAWRLASIVDAAAG
jgi:hypothetical protein